MNNSRFKVGECFSQIYELFFVFSRIFRIFAEIYFTMQFVNTEIPEGLTFDDVLLVPARSEVLPRAVDVSTKFTKDISLRTPIVSSAMDTVTEAELAIAMARAGGIGVIHKNMTIAQQCEQVRRVKRAENGMIYDPVTIGSEATVGDALALSFTVTVSIGKTFLIGVLCYRPNIFP